MPKKLESSPDAWTPPDTGRETITLHLKTITPMFGGGHTARELDTVIPVRPAAIRGALRFWWRATEGAKFSTVEALYKAESNLWGRDTDGDNPGHSNVAIALRVESAPQPVEYGSSPGHRDWPGYGLFPFRRQQDGTPPAQCLPPGLVFCLTLSVPACYIAQIQEAVRAWIHFGGIGARTRRGCGSLELLSISEGTLPALSNVEVPGGSSWPLLPATALLADVGNNADPLRAWKLAVEAYAKYRTMPPFARDPHGNPDEQGRSKPGRSYWPEPDAIRRITETHKHRPVHSVPIGFPRADLGLPIIFHYQQDRRLPGREPDDVTLEGADSGFTRFASPVVSKAVFYQNSWKSLILILNSPHVWSKNILLKRSGTVLRAVPQAEIDLGGAFSPISSLSAAGVREGLVNFLAGQGFQQVAMGGWK
jgi:CRISPR-associated protein Cmr1